MNKYQEAFDKIYWANPNRYDYTDEHLMLQELVDRATPKKIIEATEEGYKVYRCPSCNEGVCPDDYYCFKCGQALD